MMKRALGIALFIAVVVIGYLQFVYPQATRWSNKAGDYDQATAMVQSRVNAALKVDQARSDWEARLSTLRARIPVDTQWPAFVTSVQAAAFGSGGFVSKVAETGAPEELALGANSAATAAKNNGAPAAASNSSADGTTISITLVAQIPADRVGAYLDSLVTLNRVLRIDKIVTPWPTGTGPVSVSIEGAVFAQPSVTPPALPAP
jgi:hypothetical protein